MKIIKLLLLLLCISSFVKGQIYFEKTYDIDTLPEISTSILVEDSTYIITSDTWINGYRNLNFLELDDGGNINISKNYGKDSFNFTSGNYDNLTKINGNYFVTGEESNLSSIGKFTLIKINSIGDTIFTKKHELDNGSAGFSLLNLNNYIYISGYTFHYDNPGFSNLRAFLMKFDLFGNKVWHKEYNFSTIFRKIEPLSDGNLVMAGRIETDNGINEFDIVVTKVDTAGNEIWTYAPVKLEYQSLEGLVVTPNDEIVAYGYDDGKFLLIKLDTDGNLIWEKTYRGGSNSFFNLEILPDGSFIGCGEGTSFLSNSIMGTILKICPEGELEWIRYYGATNFPSHFYDVEPTHDGGYIAVGSTLGSSGTQDIWVMKMDSLGCDTAGCAVNQTPFICPDDTLSIPSSVAESINFKVYPNPFNETFTINFSSLRRKYDRGNLSINIYNVLGKKVLNQKIPNQVGNDAVVLDGSQLQKGVYIIEVEGVGKTKIVKN